MNKNPYKILGITKNNSIEEIKKIYKKIALECHPDKTLNEPEHIRDIMNSRFKEATEAYKIIIDNPNIDYTNIDDNYYYDNFNYESYNYNDWIDIFSDFIYFRRGIYEKVLKHARAVGGPGLHLGQGRACAGCCGAPSSQAP